ncbi:GNAT family N-acetyltransferase, partial [Paraburkholderia tropica]|uniref:GNAT family N-acetyltransferase n=2 Tax=Paraburkholderia tropica TaxID=92647 RepID=UPI001CC4ECB2
ANFGRSTSRSGSPTICIEQPPFLFQPGTVSMQPVLIDLPDPIHTERLVIRAPRQGDGQQVFEATIESLEALREFPASLPWAMEEPSLDASEAFCRVGASNFIARRDFPFLFLSRDSGELVGCGGLHNPRWKSGTFEAGWWGRTSWTRQGLISEAVTAIVDLAFSAFAAHRVEALTDDLNPNAWRLCERVGMELEGVLRNSRVEPGGTLRNTRVYSKIRQ